jgi:glycosyltransferase involved in cell wall biosynthesis
MRALPQAEKFVDGLTIYLSKSNVYDAAFNFRCGLGIASSRFGITLPEWLKNSYEERISHGDLRRSAADVVFGCSPTNVTHLPLIGHSGPLHEQEMLARGVPQREIDLIKGMMKRVFRRSHLVTFHSQAMADTVLEFAAPELESTVRVLPFLLPHLRLAPRELVESKFAKLETIKLLFVGREARRKGLPAVLEAFASANARYPRRLELKVISNFGDGGVELPNLPNVSHMREANREQVTAAMLESHMLLMPSKRETFGWVYIEAMAAGAVCLACDRPTQSEILDNGRAGLLVEPTPEAVTKEMLRVLAHPEGLGELALRGWERVSSTYLPEAAAKRMKELGFEAMERFAAGRR